MSVTTAMQTKFQERAKALIAALGNHDGDILAAPGVEWEEHCSGSASVNDTNGIRTAEVILYFMSRTGREIEFECNESVRRVITGVAEGAQIPSSVDPETGKWDYIGEISDPDIWVRLEWKDPALNEVASSISIEDGSWANGNSNGDSINGRSNAHENGA